MILAPVSLASIAYELSERSLYARKLSALFAKQPTLKDEIGGHFAITHKFVDWKLGRDETTHWSEGSDYWNAVNYAFETLPYQRCGHILSFCSL